MMLCWTLFWVFFRISVLSIGGGYNMIPLMQEGLVEREWLTDAQFTELIGLSEATPGPIAVNAATLTGWRVAGAGGALAATAGVCLPGGALVAALGAWLVRKREHPAVKGVLRWMGPALAGLLGATAWKLGVVLWGGAGRVDGVAAGVAAVSFLWLLGWKGSPGWVFAAAVVAGLAFGAGG